MKKLVLGVSAMALLGLASCKKDYDCECTYQNTGSTTTVTEHKTIKNSSLDDAKKTCDGYESSDGTITKTCTLL
ncbi:hypothetical protein [Fluviicola chungangensis]|uniref:Lipoprotein n=1 Tax=Fluviicola chungangensis TaxID=2597671 RepID=A0A556MYP8_9FLAO|nr:hypothetical protein [Fluviicola chungangensis]TSJ45050.1 hypothetical protein FO442_10680 [Fluviicola chungangensis]